MAAPLILAGLGPGDPDAITRRAERALRAAGREDGSGGSLFLRTAVHPTVELLRSWNLAFETFDSLYEEGSDFSAVYEGIASRVIAAARIADGARPVVYAVPGHPLFAEEASRLIMEAADAASIETEIIGAESFVGAALTAVRASLGDGCDLRDAFSLTLSDSIDRQGNAVGGGVDSSRALLVYQLYDTASASHAKLALMREYPDEWDVMLIRWAGIPGRGEVRTIPLYQLDRQHVDHLTSLYVPPLPPSERRLSFPTLVGLMARLRASDGCPWDREQTHDTLRRFFIEETYEVIEAIDAGDTDLLCEELGDVLLQVVFHAQLAAEEGTFNIDDVSERIVEKLVRRHPHVFGTVDVSDSAEVLRNWEVIKRSEKAGAETPWRESILDGVPKGLPALMQAAELSKRVARVGFEWPDMEAVIAKLDEELAELRTELTAPEPNAERIASELGDLLFTIVQVARWRKVDPEEALRGMLARFSARFGYIEKHAKDQGRSLSDIPLAEMDALWNEAKRSLN